MFYHSVRHLRAFPTRHSTSAIGGTSDPEPPEQSGEIETDEDEDDDDE